MPYFISKTVTTQQQITFLYHLQEVVMFIQYIYQWPLLWLQLWI